MDKYELLLHDIKDILVTIDEVNTVSHGKAVSLTDEDTFTSIYISPTADTFDLISTGYDASKYDNFLYIRLVINMNCTDDELAWVRTRRKVVDAILNDSPIWSNIIDRDVISARHDDYSNFPLKAMELLFEFRLRETCVV